MRWGTFSIFRTREAPLQREGGQVRGHIQAPAPGRRDEGGCTVTPAFSCGLDSDLDPQRLLPVALSKQVKALARDPRVEGTG